MEFLGLGTVYRVFLSDMAEIGTDIQKAAELILAGQCVAIPTETVYGLAANALNEKAVADIFRMKGRPDFDPLIVHVADLTQALEYVENVPDMARELADAFWPGPMTLVLPKNMRVPGIVTSGLGTVGIRVPDHAMTLELLRMLKVPLAAPSANPFGYVSPSRAEHVQAQLGERIPYILDGGPCRVGIESTIVGFTDGKPVILRPGMIHAEDIRSVTGIYPEVRTSASRPEAPGMLSSHYAPRTPVEIYQQQRPALGSGLLTWKPFENAESFERVFVLSETGDPYEAARNLYQGLRELDGVGLKRIYVEFPPEGEEWLGIRDRLKRAAYSGLAQ